MTLVTVGSVTGAPGASTTALAVVRCRRQPSVLIEADPDGGCLTSWLGVEHRPGLIDLLASVHRNQTPEPFDWVYRGDEHSTAKMVVGHPAGEVMSRALRAGAHDLLRVIEFAALDVLCDVGRYRLDSPAAPLFAAASTRVIVTHGELADLAVLSQTLVSLRREGAVVVVVTGNSRYRVDEIAEVLEVPTVGVPPVGAPLPSRRYMRAIEALTDRLWNGADHER
jgi:MinD-like ATPase involved in chromosome partitioning or flagellar assembly